MAPTHQFFYISELVAGGKYTVVSAVTTVARERNPALGITGAMVFDGERFAQLLEGSERAVTRLSDAIVADRRHRHVRTLHQGPSSLGPRFVSWQNGYCGVDDLDVFGNDANGLHGEAAVDAFLALLARCDMRS